jgi:hypothetical protein
MSATDVGGFFSYHEERTISSFTDPYYVVEYSCGGIIYTPRLTQSKSIALGISTEAGTISGFLLESIFYETFSFSSTVYHYKLVLAFFFTWPMELAVSCSTGEWAGYSRSV